MRFFLSRKKASIAKKWKNLVVKILFLLGFIMPFGSGNGQSNVSTTDSPCFSNPCIYGICLDDANGTFHCYCIDGFTGFLCQTNWDECWSDPCKNGGLCIDGVAEYNCTCLQGYQGDLCEHNINECDSNPCRNNGTCIDGSNGFKCSCPSGYLGNFCETDVSVCNDTRETRCMNGGLCTEGPGFTFNCVCPPGWSGQLCEESIDECASSPCQNGAVCLDLHANYMCACPFGYSGRNCEAELEMCGDSSPCQNGALCLVEDWLRVCYCVPDYHGDRCQYRYDECLLGPGCKNGGTCVDGVDGYNCSCPPGWSGNYCECFMVNDGNMHCDKIYSQDEGVTQPPQSHQTVPKFWTEIQVPKTTPHKTFSSTTVQTPLTTQHRQLIPPYSTECFPIWPRYTIKTPKTSTQVISTEKNLPNDFSETKNISTTLEVAEIKTSLISTPKTLIMTTTSFTPVTGTTSKPKTKTTIAESTTFTNIITSVFTTTPLPETIPTSKKSTLSSTSILTTFISNTTYLPLTTMPTTPTPTTSYFWKSTFLKFSPTVNTLINTTLQSTTTTTALIPTTSSTTTTTTTTTTTKSTTTLPETVAVQTATEPQKTSKSISEFTTSTETKSPTTVSQVSFEPTHKHISTTTPKSTTQILIGNETLSQPTMTSLPTTMTKNCKIMPCYNGGSCLNTTIGLKCICKPHWEGLYCDEKTDIKIVGFSKNSYLSHRLTATKNITIELSAKTISLVGVILYSHLGHNMFMTLYLENGLLKFKFSCGIQKMVLSEVQDNLHNGYDFVLRVSLNFISRAKGQNHCVATVRLNNTISMSGEQSTDRPLTYLGSTWVYIGGVPTQYINVEEIPSPEGFIGCMHDLKIDGKTKGIFKDSFESVGVTPCKSLACLSNPCRGGSTCKEHNNTWTCLCPSGFLGRSCEISVCENNPCQYGGTCVPFPGSGFLCLCPLGKQGLFCENSVGTENPLFASSINGLSSFAAYKIAAEIYQDFQLTFKFVPYDMEQISLMMFLGQDGYHGPKSDHLAVSFIKGYIVLTWNLGSGPRRIFTPNPVPNLGYLFHTVKIGRTGQRAWLAVGNQNNVTGKSPGRLTQLNTRSIVYLGGHDSQNFSHLPHDLPLHTGFSGCLFDVELTTDQMLIKVDKTTPVFSRGIGKCGQTLCKENSCENGGGCISHGATFTCLCSEGWFGPTCSSKYNPCDSSRHNCSEGSTCVPLKTNYSCDCPVGKTGKFCEKDEDFSDVKFKGIRSYIALSLTGLNQHQSCIELEIRPLSNDGLILYSSQPEKNSFWSLSLQEGMVELRVFPGVQRKREVLVVQSRRILALEKWHRIRTGRYGRNLYLWVEGTVSTAILLPGENLPFGATTVYLGGSHDLSKLPVETTRNAVKPFKGCIRKFGSQWKTIPLTKATILHGRNVEDCDGTVCGGDVCQNGGTCHINSFNVPICACLKQYTGKKCEYRLSCQQVRCQNGGRCEETEKKSFLCYCPNGWNGPFCESVASIKSPRFGGNSYLMIDKSEVTANTKKRNVGNRLDVDFIRLNFTTPEPNGFILWSSRKNSNEFVGIGVENEKLKLVWAWTGHNTTVVSSDLYVSDGIWHDLIIKFGSPNISIWMDQRVFYNTNNNYPGYPPSTDGKFYLGGFPETEIVADRTFNHFRNGFDGCLQQLSWAVEFPILNFSYFKGENIRTCELFGT